MNTDLQAGIETLECMSQGALSELSKNGARAILAELARLLQENNALQLEILILEAAEAEKARLDIRELLWLQEKARERGRSEADAGRCD